MDMDSLVFRRAAWTGSWRGALACLVQEGMEATLEPDFLFFHADLKSQDTANIPKQLCTVAALHPLCRTSSRAYSAGSCRAYFAQHEEYPARSGGAHPFRRARAPGARTPSGQPPTVQPERHSESFQSAKRTCSAIGKRMETSTKHSARRSYTDPRAAPPGLASTLAAASVRNRSSQRSLGGFHFPPCHEACNSRQRLTTQSSSDCKNLPEAART